MEKQKYISQATAHKLLEICRSALEWHSAFPHGNVEFEKTTSAELYQVLQAAIAKVERGNDRCAKCGDEAAPDTDPPLCIICLQDQSAEPPRMPYPETKEE